MKPTESVDAGHHRLGDRRRRRALLRKRISVLALAAAFIAVLVYGILLFLAFEGSRSSLVLSNEERPRYREIEFAIFLGTASLPVLSYLVWRRCVRRKR